jgi:hypothetical protein
VKQSLFVLTMLLIFYSTCFSQDEKPAGSIKKLEGVATIIRNGTPVETRIGSRFYRNDSVKTGGNGAISIVFKDDTLLSLGPNSEVRIKDFMFSPAEGKLSIVTRLLRGTSAYISGIIGKLSPESVSFETPTAKVGIRGTKFVVSAEGGERESE